MLKQRIVTTSVLSVLSLKYPKEVKVSWFLCLGRLIFQIDNGVQLSI